MTTHFHNQLGSLKLIVLEQAALTEKALDKAVSALLERDAASAQGIIDNDCQINALQADVDELSLKLLALDQPMARDLRLIIGSIHVASNLERVADQAVNIAERAILFADRADLPRVPLFDQLIELVCAMVRDAVKAYNQDDTDLALSVCARDPRADELSLKVLKHFVDYMVKESRSVERAVHMIILARCLERVGDLAANIAEHVLFIVKGVNVKSTCHRL